MASWSTASARRLSARIRLCAILPAFLLGLALLSPVYAQTPTPTEADDRRAAIVRLIGTSSVTPTPASIRIGELFLAVRRGDMTAPQFFQALKPKLGMADVRTARTLIEKAGMLDVFLGPKSGGAGTPVEKTLLEHRRRVTETLIRQVVRSMPADATVFVAKVGSWASKAAEDLTFDGDIDFSFICADMRVAKALKTAFDAMLLDVFGLAGDARSADVVATAHGLGDAEVYTGDEGQGFAEQALEQAEAKAKAEGKTLVLIERVDAAGALQPTEMAFMRARIADERGAITERSARLPEVDVPTDPGLSMEMVRHLLHDIKGSTEYPPSVLIVKASKYLQRSDQSAAEGGNRSTSSVSQQAEKIVELSQGKDAGALVDLLAENFGKDGVITEAAAAEYISKVERAIWRNIEVSVHAKADGLEKLADEAERATGAERDKLVAELHDKTLALHDTLSAKLLMLKSAHVEVPTSLDAQIQRVTRIVELLAKLGAPITDDEMRQKRFVEEMLKASTPSALKLALAKCYDVATRLGEGLNSKLDFIDDYMLGKLRGDRDAEAFFKEAKETELLMKSADPAVAAAARERANGLGQRAKAGLATINRTLNEVIQSSAVGRGASHGLLAFGLREELPLYVEAIWNGDFDTFAMEFFRHRMPMFSAVEGVYVEGNPSDYVMAGWDLITTLVPPVGLGRAAVGIGEQIAEAGISFYWDERLNVFVDEVYAGARFKPTSKTHEGDAWVAEWRLVGVTYRGESYDLKTFTENRRDQLKAMAAELRKPAKTRDLSKPLYGHETGLIDKASVDETLRKTLYASDSLLNLLEQLRAHPQAGPALKAHFEDQERVRWEQVKLAFLVDLINRLEDRWAHDWAARAGQMPALLAELKRLTGELEITDQVVAKMAAANPGRLKTMAAWFLAVKRDQFLQPDAATAAEAEVGLIMDAVVAYRAVLETRAKIEKQLGIPEGRDGGMRLLTDPSQLHGLPATDRDVAAGWASSVDRLGDKAEDELRTLKARVTGVSLEQTALEAGFDRDALRRLHAIDVWRYAWANLLRGGDAMARPGWLDDPTAATERLKASRAALIEEFEAHYRMAGVLEVTVADAATGAAIERAEVGLGAAKATTDRQGLAILFGIQPGSYDLSASAPDHKPGSILALVYPVPVAEALGNRRAVKLALAPAKVEPRRSALTLRVADAGDGKPLVGAKVTIIGAAAKTPIVRQTGANGEARFDDLLPGVWIAAAEAADHEPAKSGTIVLPVGKTGPSAATVSIPLKRLAPSTKQDDKDKPQLTPPDGKIAETTSGKFKLDLTPNTLPPVDMTTWRVTMNSLDLYLLTPSWTRLSPADREKAKSVIAALEAREKVLWDAASAELGLADAYLGRIRAEAKKVFDGFRAKLPKSPAARVCGEPGNACVTDLEGNLVGQRPVCEEGKILAVEAPALNSIDNEILRVSQARERFKAFSTDHAAYANAMEGLDNLMIDQKRGDAWKTRGWTQTFPDPCGGPSVTATLPPAGVPASPIATQTDLGLTARLAFDAKTLGRPEVEVVAEAVNGEAPYRFEFPGAIRATETRAVFAAPFAKDPTAKASVRVIDAKGGTATAELPLEPALVQVELTRTDSAGAELPVGGAATFAAALSSNGKRLDPTDWVLRWEPITEVRFASAEGVGVVANTATFLRAGPTKIWVIALRRQAGTLATVAESPQIEIDVVAPGLSLQAEPRAPFVGDTVTIKAHEAPASNDADVSFRWSLAGDAQAAGPTSDQRVYTFVAASDKPVTISLDTLARAKGDTLASAQVRVTPQARTVTATNLGPSFGADTTKIVLWKPGVGLVWTENQITAFMDLTVKASVEPAPADPVRWAWSLNEGSSFSGNPASAETRVQRSTPGVIEATVIARDGHGIELGRGALSITVAVSDEAVREGRQKLKDLDGAKARGDAAWATGDLDAACAAGEAARAVQPDAAYARLWCDGRDRIRALVGEMDAALASARTPAGLDAAAKKLAAAEAIHAKAAPLAPARQRLEAARTAISGNKDDAAVDRKRRLELIASGAAACKAEKWQACRDQLAKGLDGGDKVFTPADAGIVAKAQALRATAEAELKKASGDQTAKAADRQQRMALLLASAAACKAEKWQDCRDAIAKGLDGGDGVFTPADAGIVAKAQALQATAEAELKKAADDATRKQAADAKTDAERKQRLGQLLAGGQACQAAKWAECREAIGKGLAGSDKVFKPEDGKIVDKARALGARAEAEMLKAAAAKSTTPDTAKESSPPTTPKVEGADPATPTNSAPDNAKQSASPQAQTQAPANQPGAPFDGVYVGPSTRDDGARGPMLTWTIAGSRIRLVSDAVAEKHTWTGEIKPSGEFKVQVERIAYTGTVAGNSLTGAYAGELRMFNGTWNSTVKGTFGASRTTPAPAPTTLNGVYVGKGSDSSGEMSGAYTWTVSGSRIELTESLQQQKSAHVGTIDPSGAFVIQGGPKHVTVKGRIQGDTLSATWDYPASEETNEANHGALSASRASQQPSPPQPTQVPEAAATPTPATPSASGYWKLDHVEYANPHGADEWTKDEEKYKVLQRDNNQITFHEEMNDGMRLTYSVKWRIPETLVPGQSPAVELSETCIAFTPGRNSSQRWMATALLDSDFLIGDLKLDDPTCAVGGAARAESRKWNIRVGRPGLKTAITVTADVLNQVEYKFVFAWLGGAAATSGQP